MLTPNPPAAPSRGHGRGGMYAKRRAAWMAAALAGMVCGPCMGYGMGYAGAQRAVGRGPGQIAPLSQRPERVAPPLSRLNLPHPGYLGIGLRDLDAAEESRLQLRDEMGAMIISVDHDAPAWAAGLRPGDIVTGFDGEPVDDVDALRRRLRSCNQGRAITLRVIRDGLETTIPVTLGDEQVIAQQALSRHMAAGTGGPAQTLLAAAASGFTAPPPPAPASAPAPAVTPQRSMAATLLDTLIPASSYTGLDVSPLTPQLAVYFGVPGGRGLLVDSVRKGSPAESAGLLAGDVILRANDKPVSSRSNLAHAVRGAAGAAIPLTVLRSRRLLSLTIRPGKQKSH